jgi:hypothetical protein
VKYAVVGVMVAAAVVVSLLAAEVGLWVMFLIVVPFALVAWPLLLRSPR